MVDGTARVLEAAIKWLVVASLLAVPLGLALLFTVGACHAVSVYSILSSPVLALLACCLLLARVALLRSPDSLMFFLEVAVLGVVEFFFCYFVALRQCSPI